jgi:hypothetical protein
MFRFHFTRIYKLNKIYALQPTHLISIFIKFNIAVYTVYCRANFVFIRVKRRGFIKNRLMARRNPQTARDKMQIS